VNGRCTIAGDALEDQCTTTANAFEGLLHNHGAFPRGMIRLFLLGVRDAFDLLWKLIEPRIPPSQQISSEWRHSVNYLDLSRQDNFWILHIRKYCDLFRY